MSVTTIQGVFTSSVWTGPKITLTDVFGTSLEFWVNGNTVQRYPVLPISTSGDRNPSGSVILQGNSGLAYHVWVFSGVKVSGEMKRLLDGILAANQKALRNKSLFVTGLLDQFEVVQYDSSEGSVTKLPVWNGSPITNEWGYLEGFASFPVVLKIANNYAQYLGGDVYSVSFSAEEVA